MAYVTFWSAGAGLAFAVCLLGSGATVGCSTSPTPVGAASPDGTRSTFIQHEVCDDKGHKSESLDVTGDGNPDILKVRDGSREICRITDLNHDGHPDLYEYFDASGLLRRREYDFDDNTVINQIDIFEGGKLVRRELDTKNQGQLDTWDTYDAATGKLLKRERDSTGDGKVDQWWTWEADRVTIASDRNGDGLPEPEETMVLGLDGKPIFDAGAPSPSTPPAAVADAGPDLTTPPASTASVPDSPLVLSDAGIPGKPTRGGAKR